MATTMARERWTDERLDDLAVNVDRRFDRVDADIRDLRSDMAREFERTHDEFGRTHADFGELRGEMNERFNAVDARFDKLQQTIILGFAGIVASICGTAIAAILANQL